MFGFDSLTIGSSTASDLLTGDFGHHRHHPDPPTVDHLHLHGWLLRGLLLQAHVGPKCLQTATGPQSLYKRCKCLVELAVSFFDLPMFVCRSCFTFSFRRSRIHENSGLSGGFRKSHDFHYGSRINSHYSFLLTHDDDFLDVRQYFAVDDTVDLLPAVVVLIQRTEDARE